MRPSRSSTRLAVPAFPDSCGPGTLPPPGQPDVGSPDLIYRAGEALGPEGGAVWARDGGADHRGMVGRRDAPALRVPGRGWSYPREPDTGIRTAFGVLCLAISVALVAVGYQFGRSESDNASR
jgi:hypothetical protein